MRANLSAAALAASLLGGCASQPLMPYSADTPPLVVVPVAQAGVQDKRARFREIFCAVLEARKDTTSPTIGRATKRSLAWASSLPAPRRPVTLAPSRRRLVASWCRDSATTVSSPGSKHPARLRAPARTGL